MLVLNDDGLHSVYEEEKIVYLQGCPTQEMKYSQLDMENWAKTKVEDFLRQQEWDKSPAKARLDSFQDSRKEVERIGWDSLFMEICELVAKRSLDSRTQMGAVIVKNNRILSTGYNSFVREIDDSKLPNVAPAKYDWFVCHAEVNALLNCCRNGVSTDGAEIYISGRPCFSCLQFMWNSGITKITHGDKLAVMCDKSEEYLNTEILLHLIGDRLKLVHFSPVKRI